jgi:DNA polymerase III subunit delta
LPLCCYSKNKQFEEVVALKSGEIDGFLKKPDPRYAIILIYGPDRGLVHERARLLAHQSVPDPEDPFQLIKLDAESLSNDPQRLVDEALTIPLFAGKRTLWVRMGQATLSEAIETLCQENLTDTKLILEAGDLGPRQPLRAQIEKAKQAIALPCYADEGRNLGDLVDQILSAAGQRIERDAKQALLEKLGADRLMSRQEIEKLSLYASGQEMITITDVDAVMADTGIVNLDRLIDATFSGQNQDCDEMLRRCLSEGLDVGTLISALLRHALTLQSSRLMRDEGKDMRSIEQVARVHFRRQTAFQKQVNHWTCNALDKAILYLSETQSQSRKNAGLAAHLLSRCCLQLSLAARKSH